MAAWTILDESRFDGYLGDQGRQGPLSGHILVRVSDTGRSEEHYRVAVTGSSPVSHTFPLTAVSLVSSLSHYSITVEAEPDEMAFKPNTFVSKWENLDDLVAAERASATTDEDEDADDAFHAAWATAKDEGEAVAVSMQWSVQGHRTGNLELVLQALPTTARSIRSDARLMADSAATIELARWKLDTQKTESGPLKGPRPILFAEDAAAAREALEQHPDRQNKGRQTYIDKNRNRKLVQINRIRNREI